ncbi:MAG: SpoIIE family protein phosphatase [Anaerolineales bacterium]|nr:SpoIIE family protein phosphatase [Chloroflexota bacterium]MBL6983648.1 SpoIIE family protein phosphatase [Anaerolineales bacterium]
MTEVSTPAFGSRFELLYQLSQTFNSSLDLDEVLNRVMDEVIEAIGAERGFVALKDDDGALEFRSARGIEHTSIEDPESQISHSVIEEVLQKEETVLTHDAQSDDRFSNRSSVLDLQLRSILCAPLLLKDKILGVIYVDNRIFAGFFSNDELELMTAIASSAAVAIDNARLYEIAVEKGRMERELQMAYRVQSSLITEDLPKTPGWEFAASWHPAREVSGDFYDFIPYQGDKLCLVIADVTDKGMPAALFMALTRSLVRASLDRADSLSEGIARANYLICSDSNISMPVTLFLCSIDANKEISFVNAGHNPTIHFDVSESELIKLTRTGMFLGFDEEAVYNQEKISLDSGDFLVFYTDGVPDAINEDKETFGMERFLKVIEENPNASASEILAAIEKAVQDFIGDTAPYDDLTLLIAKRV